MKQANNAIKFLMAQYRAIFKNAYFKGLTSAVLLTAGLAAAGGAQAAATSLTHTTVVGTSTGWADLGADKYTVDGSGTATNTFDKIEITNNTNPSLVNSKAFTLNITSGGTNNKIDASASGALSVTADNATINLSGTTAANAALTVKGADSSKTATLHVDTFTVGNGQLTLESAATDATGAATLKADTINLTGGTGATDSKISFKGSGAASAVLHGHLVADSVTNLTTLEFTNNGTLETYGTDVNVNISVAKGASAANTGALSIEDDIDTTNVDEGLLSIKTGTISIEGSDQNNKGGVLSVQKGILELGKEVKVTTKGSDTTGAATLQLSGSSDVSDATLRVYANTIKNFLAADGDVAGAVNLTKGTISLQDTEQVDLATDFGSDVFAGSVTAGKINVANSSVIAGEDLAISSKLTSATSLVVHATDLTLGSSNFSGTDGLGISGATARNLTLLSSLETFTLADDVTLQAIDEVDNPFLTADGTIKVAGNGQLEAKNTTISGGSLIVAAGNYSTGYNVTVDSGTLTVGNKTTPTDEAYGVDASLKLTGKLSLDNTHGANTITVAGNGASQSINTDDGTPIARPVSATLDLTDAEIAITRSSN